MTPVISSNADREVNVKLWAELGGHPIPRASRASQSPLQYQNGFQVGPSVNFR